MTEAVDELRLTRQALALFPSPTLNFSQQRGVDLMMLTGEDTGAGHRSQAARSDREVGDMRGSPMKLAPRPATSFGNEK